MHAVELIERKRNGEELSAADVREFVAAYVREDIPDYQAAAFLMAVWFRGLTPAETYAMTDAMVASGETVDLAGLEDLEDVADLHVVVVREMDAALEALGDLASVVLEPLEVHGLGLVLLLELLHRVLGKRLALVLDLLLEVAELLLALHELVLLALLQLLHAGEALLADG